jgi:hypothetical protein
MFPQLAAAFLNAVDSLTVAHDKMTFFILKLRLIFTVNSKLSKSSILHSLLKSKHIFSGFEMSFLPLA